MIVKLLIEHHLECLSLKGGCRGSSESTHVKCHIVGNIMHWLKFKYQQSHELAQMVRPDGQTEDWFGYSFSSDTL